MPPLAHRVLAAPRRAAIAALRWIAPARCAACDEMLTEEDLACGAAFCAICEVSLVANDFACPRCAEPFGATPRHPLPAPECAACRRAPPPQARSFSPYEYGGQLAVALRLLKHQRRRDLARSLAPLFAAPLADAIAASGAQRIIPIPLSYRRMIARGFNQSASLARFAARPLAVTVDTTVLTRTRHTRPQAGLSRRAREHNLHGAFAVAGATSQPLAGEQLLLFDDILTTGATVRAAAAALLGAGAGSVSVFACARATDLR